MKIRKNIQSMYQKNCKEKHVDLLLIQDEKNTMFASMVLIESCIIIMFTCFRYRRNIKASS